MKLTERQRRFVETYAATGNASESARIAGYRGAANRIGPRLLANVGMQSALCQLSEQMTTMALSTARERQEWWTAIMRDPTIRTRDRLRASEILGKAQGDFIQRHTITGPTALSKPEVHVALEERLETLRKSMSPQKTIAEEMGCMSSEERIAVVSKLLTSEELAVALRQSLQFRMSLYDVLGIDGPLESA